MLIRLGLVGALFIAASVSPSTGRACSLAPNPGPFEPNGANDAVAPTLSSAKLLIRRAKDPGGTGGDCSGVASYTVVVEASDDETEAGGLGYEVTLLRGTLPFALLQGPVIAEGSVREPGKLVVTRDDTGDAYDATVAIRVLDRAGNRSDPIEVHVSDGAVAGGCAIGPGRARQSSSIVAGLLLLGLARRGRARKAAD